MYTYTPKMKWKKRLRLSLLREGEFHIHVFSNNTTMHHYKHGVPTNYLET
jgi:hypothetical protein